MIELKEYQRNVLDTFSRWLETLEETKGELETMIEMFQQAPTRIPIPMNYTTTQKQHGKNLKKTAGLRQPLANTLTAPTTQTVPFHTSALKCQRVAVKP